LYHQEFWGIIPEKFCALFIPTRVLKIHSPPKDSNIYACARTNHPLKSLVKWSYDGGCGLGHSHSPGVGLVTNHELVLS